MFIATEAQKHRKEYVFLLYYFCASVANQNLPQAESINGIYVLNLSKHLWQKKALQRIAGPAYSVRTELLFYQFLYNGCIICFNVQHVRS